MRVIGGPSRDLACIRCSHAPGRTEAGLVERSGRSADLTSARDRGPQRQLHCRGSCRMLAAPLEATVWLAVGADALGAPEKSIDPRLPVNERARSARLAPGEPPIRTLRGLPGRLVRSSRAAERQGQIDHVRARVASVDDRSLTRLRLNALRADAGSPRPGR